MPIKRIIRCVVASLTQDGDPTFYPVAVAANVSQFAEGRHLDTAAGSAAKAGLKLTMPPVVFDEVDSPSILRIGLLFEGRVSCDFQAEDDHEDEYQKSPFHALAPA